MTDKNKTGLNGQGSDQRNVCSKHTDWIVAHIAEEAARNFIKFGIDSRKANLIFNEVLNLTELPKI